MTRTRRPLWFIASMLLSLLSLSAQAAPASYEQAQIYACRAASSFMIYRGEGLQPEHAQQVQADLQELQNVTQPLLAQGDAALNSALKNLVAQLQEGMQYGPEEEDMPWAFPSNLSKNLRSFLKASMDAEQRQGLSSGVSPKIQYLMTQYIYSAYFGLFEISRESPDIYLGQTEVQLIPQIEAAVGSDTAGTDAKTRTRWKFLKTALADMDSSVSSNSTRSKRPFAPLVVDRHGRSLTGLLLQQPGT